MTELAPPKPPWERRYPGRMAAELDDLRAAGIAFEIDSEAIARGILKLAFNWPLDGVTHRLEATYPSGFPEIRPQVKLITAGPYPERHASPIDGNLCLLGRGGYQWSSDLTLRQLLEQQLAASLSGQGEEDPQGEPLEFWWNFAGLPTSGILTASNWSLDGATKGQLRLVATVTKGPQGLPCVRGVVTDIRADGKTITGLDPAIWPAAATGTPRLIPWLFVDKPLLPRSNAWGRQLGDLVRRTPHLQPVHDLGAGYVGQFFALAYPAELAWKTQGVGWLFFVIHGSRKDFQRGRALNITPVRTYRAGEADLGARVPAVAQFRQRRIAVIGLGAIGGPIAVELARNGCGEMPLLEHDVVEPGNSIRWPLGSSAWGAEKLDALIAFIRREYPRTKIIPYPLAIGNPDDERGDDAILTDIAANTDLVIDATASFGITNLLSSYCRASKIPLISVSASPNLAGGAVARFVPASGCPVCLERHWHAGSIQRPHGLGNDVGLQQPPGCAERTFTGASFDLQELSLQAVRLAFASLANGAVGSLIQTLALADADGHSILPQWREDPIPRHPDCTCAAA